MVSKTMTTGFIRQYGSLREGKPSAPGTHGSDACFRCASAGMVCRTRNGSYS